MGFQSTVSPTQGFGIVGEVYDDSPKRADSYIMETATASNKVGYAFTITSEGKASAGGTDPFAGILVHPKQYANYNGDFAVSNEVKQYENADLLTMGRIIVNLGATAVIGNLVKYTNATGILGVGTAGAGETQVPNCKVIKFDVGANGVALIELTN